VIDADPFDLNHVEVLRGPLGGLYGAGSMGGTIGLATNPPKLGTHEASTSVRPISRTPLVCNSLPSSHCHPYKNVSSMVTLAEGRSQ
jgi:hypothetical protein